MENLDEQQQNQGDLNAGNATPPQGDFDGSGVGANLPDEGKYKPSEDPGAEETGKVAVSAEVAEQKKTSEDELVDAAQKAYEASTGNVWADASDVEKQEAVLAAAYFRQNPDAHPDQQYEAEVADKKRSPYSRSVRFPKFSELAEEQRTVKTIFAHTAKGVFEGFKEQKKKAEQEAAA